MTQDQADSMAPFRRILERGSGGPPIWQVMGITLLAAEPGTVTMRGEPRAEHGNGIGSIHGGYVATILDSVMACAVQTGLPAHTAYSTAEFKISFVRKVQPDDEIFAVGTVLSAGRRLATAEGFLRDREGRLLAHGTTTCILL